MSPEPLVSGKILASLVSRGMARSRQVRLRVKGTCMAPLLREGDWITVSNDGSSLNNGDLVLVHTSGAWQCHRLLGIEGREWLVAGDRTTLVTRHNRDEIIGRVTEIVRNDRVLNPHQSPFGYLAPLVAGLNRHSSGSTRALRTCLRLIRAFLCQILGLQWHLPFKTRQPDRDHSLIGVRP